MIGLILMVISFRIEMGQAIRRLPQSLQRLGCVCDYWLLGLAQPVPQYQKH